MHDSESENLSRLNDEQLSAIFERRGNEIGALEALGRVLQQRDSDAAIALHMRVAKRLVALRPALRKVGSPQQWLHAFLRARNLSSPSGRPLYRYRMTDSEYGQAKRLIRELARSGHLFEAKAYTSGLFVAYCAEWFRRESTSTFLKWDAPAPDDFPSVSQASKRALAKAGMDFWCRKLRRSESATEYLLSVALEGGFPVGILAEGGRGWLKDYLRAIMRRAIACTAAEQEILTIATEERWRVRKLHQHDDFIALCSELAWSLLQLRLNAEAEKFEGVRNSTLLDSRHPGWRDELPIYLPDDESLVAELLTLVDEKLSGLATDGVEARRYLVKREGRWQPALQLLADGEVPSVKLPQLSSESRARAIATGELANHFPGEVALFEPPVGGKQRWRVRSIMRTTKLLAGFPFKAAVTVALSSREAAPKPWIWPRGNALQSDLLVFQPDENSTTTEPLLRFLRSGSASSPAKTLYALFPRDWCVEPADGAEVVTSIEDVPELGAQLAFLSGTTYFRSAEIDAIRFRVEPDAEERDRQLEIEPFAPAGFSLADESWEMAASPLEPLIREGTKHPRLPVLGEIFFRTPGGRWEPLSGKLVRVGQIELSWRDPVAGVQIEKRRIALFPKTASIVGTMTGDLAGEVRLEGLPGWEADVRASGCVIESAGPASLSFRFTGQPSYRLPVTLRPPTGQCFNVTVPLVAREAVIALADGTVLKPGKRIDMGALQGAVAVSPRKTVLCLGAKGSKSASLKTAVDGELPLAIVRGALKETFATLPSQDDLVELDFVGDARPSIRISRYRDEQLALDGSILRWRPQSNRSNVSPVARMILDPRHEHGLEFEGSEAWRLPERCKGPCLVYLRDGFDVVSRPLPVAQPGSPGLFFGELISALTIADHIERKHSILDALGKIGRGEAGADDIQWLREAALNLNGLPASAFDALKLLPLKPKALIQLLISAHEPGGRGTIWNLQNELPFLWLALPLGSWFSVMEHNCTALVAVLESALGKEKSMREAIAWLLSVCGDLAALEPCIETIFGMAGFPIKHTENLPSLKELTSNYVRDQHRRSGDALNDVAARLTLSGLKIPAEIESKSHTDFAGLFAPVLLAASANQKIALSNELALIARRTLREDPVYVSGAWTHLSKFYG